MTRCLIEAGAARHLLAENRTSLKSFVEAEYEKESQAKRNHRDKEADNEVA